MILGVHFLLPVMTTLHLLPPPSLFALMPVTMPPQRVCRHWSRTSHRSSLSSMTILRVRRKGTGMWWPSMWGNCLCWTLAHCFLIWRWEGEEWKRVEGRGVAGQVYMGSMGTGCGWANWKTGAELDVVWWVTWEVRQFSVVGVQRLTHIAMYVCVCA